MTTAQSTIANLANELDKVPERVEDARKALDGWRHSATRVVKRYPGRSILGALAVGFVIGKLGRYL